MMWTFCKTIFFFLWMLCGSSAQVSPPSRCPQFPMTFRMTAFRDKCLQFSHDARTWKDAKSYCWQKGGRLVNVGNQEMSSYLRTTLNGMSWNTQEVWIGLNMLDTDRWNWVGNYGDPSESMTWSNWAPDHPTSSWFRSLECAYLEKDRGLWHWKNAHCNTRGSRYNFICEYPQRPVQEVTNAPPCPDKEITTPTTSTTTTKTQSATTAWRRWTTRITSLRRETFADLESEVSGKPETPRMTKMEPPATQSHKYANRKADMVLAYTMKAMKSLIGSENNENEAYTEAPRVAASQSTLAVNIPSFIMILAFVAGICIAGLLATFLVLYRRKRTRIENKQSSATEIYLTTEYLKNAHGEVLLSPWQQNKGTDDSTCHTPKANDRAVANEYLRDEDQHSAPKSSPARFSPKSSSACDIPQSSAEIGTDPSRTNPTLAGSLSRGRLPEVPTDDGYEIPVKLIGAELPGAGETELNEEQFEECHQKEVYHEIPADSKHQIKENDYYIANTNN